MKKLLAALTASLLASTTAQANFTFTQGSGTQAFSFTGSGSCTGVQCFATAIINSSGTEIFTAGNPAQVTGANGTFPVTGTITANQGGTWNVNNIAGTITLPTGAATSANQTNKTQFVQLTDGTLAAAGYTAYGTAPSGNVPGVNAYVTNSNPNPIAKRLAVLTNTAVAIKASAGGLYVAQCGNTNASEAFLQIYSVPFGSVIVGTTTPDLSIAIAPSGTGGFTVAMPVLFTNGTNTGISAAATTTSSGGTAPTTALDCNVAYE
jgi:hypothetical protein